MISILAGKTTAVQAAELAKRLQPGEKAPFQGVFIPDWQWKHLNEDLQEKDLLKAQLAEIEQTPPPKSNSLEVFLWGLLAGSSAVLLVEKFGSK